MVGSIEQRFISQEFEGNSDGVNIKFNAVPYPLKTSEVMVVPKQWHKNIALRLELYGCEPGENSKSLRLLRLKLLCGPKARESGDLNS